MCRRLLKSFSKRHLWKRGQRFRSTSTFLFVRASAIFVFITEIWQLSQSASRHMWKLCCERSRCTPASRILGQLPIGSVFIGGGTPTVLTRDQLIRILDRLHQSFNLQGCDITVECHIQNASLEKLIALREHGVTRVSTGIQTLQHKARRDLHMAGSPDALIQWLAMAKSIGFSGVSADLMYGLPGGDPKSSSCRIWTRCSNCSSLICQCIRPLYLRIQSSTENSRSL